MPGIYRAFAVAAICAAFVIRCEDEAKPDAVKYPQETPDKALDSIAKSLEANDLAYWMKFLVTPDHTQRMIEKYKTIDAAVAANIDDPKKVEGRKALSKAIRGMQAEKKLSEGDDNGKKWARFTGAANEMVQLELQADGRWCMNVRARAAAK